MNCIVQMLKARRKEEDQRSCFSAKSCRKFWKYENSERRRRRYLVSEGYEYMKVIKVLARNKKA